MKESISYLLNNNLMKKYLLLILLILSTTFLSCQTQYEIVDKEHWITDDNFESKIKSKSLVVVEFWVKFNDVNCFKDWDKLEGITYHRADITKSSKSKRKYNVKMAPTLIIFVNGVKTKVFKAGLDLVLEAELREIQDSINELRK